MTEKTTLLLAFLVMITGAYRFAQSSAVPVVRTTHGQLCGKHEGQSDAFLGVPYARPPMGKLRWRPPVKAAAWAGIRDASQYGTNCYQDPPIPFGLYTAEYLIALPVSEDCLYLNVWTPTGRKDPMPVLVFVHGGGFNGGSGSIEIYNGAILAAKGAVVVTINYRLGVFGFLAHPELSAESASHVSGNYGLLDMIAALQWVHDNIGAFGGDPARVTLQGQSAGAIADVLLSPMAKRLFSRAIIESGPTMGIEAMQLQAEEQHGVEFAKAVAASSIKELREMPADAISRAASPPPGVLHTDWRPNLDKHVIMGDPLDASVPVQVNVPLLTGYNADEGRRVNSKNVKEFEDAVTKEFGAFAQRFLAAYPHSTDDAAVTSAHLLSRDRTMAGLYLWGEQRNKTSEETLYLYLYEHPSPSATTQNFGTFHTSEVPYIFGNLDTKRRPYTDADRRISDQLSSYWLNFASSGDPNGRGLAVWPHLQPSVAEVMWIGDTPGAGAVVSTPERLALFREYVAAGGKLPAFN